MTTRRYLVVGDPIDHSLSPRIHTAALRWNGIDGEYGRRRAGPPGMSQIAAELLAGDLDGVNVTMPNKAAAWELADELTADAQRARSVNTLWVEHGRIHGDTTDIAGTRWAWNEAGLPATGPIVVLGAGGAAAAALLAFEGREMAVAARNTDRARALVDHMRVEASIVDWGRPLGAVSVVNATPIGMHGEVLAPWVLADARGLLDMTYGRAVSPAVQNMRAAGLPAAGGELMLVGQAAVSFAIWTGAAPPHAVMLAALQNTESDQ